MRGYQYAELAAFVAVAEQRSFTRAAQQLHIAPSTLSQTIKKLEERLGAELLLRTTRRVTLSSAGVRLLERFRPAMDEMSAAVADVLDRRGSPAGLVRLHLPRPAYASLLENALADLHRQFPDIALDIVVEDSFVDLASAGYDLDIRRLAMVDPSCHATPVGGQVRHLAVASAAYLALHGRPETPADLTRHRCIRWQRPGTHGADGWTFHADGETFVIDVEGPMTVSHCDLAVTAARSSIGIAFVLEPHARRFVERCELESLLTAYLPPLGGWAVCRSRRGRLSTAAEAVTGFLIEQAKNAAKESVA